MSHKLPLVINWNKDFWNNYKGTEAEFLAMHKHFGDEKMLKEEFVKHKKTEEKK